MVFVTGNDHKRREVREILGVELEGADPDVPELQAVDPAEVAAAKALAAHRALGSRGLTSSRRTPGSWSRPGTVSRAR